MNNDIQEAAFSFSKKVIETIESVINTYMQQNNISIDKWHKYGLYTEYDKSNSVMTKEGVISYKDKPFYKFEYGINGFSGNWIK